MEILVYFVGGQSAVYTTAIWDLLITAPEVEIICSATTGEVIWERK